MSSLLECQQREFDLIVIGGGIVGVGIARDAALRGLRVALFEKNDFASGTTAGSTRLIHGGLRYLDMLDFHLVRLDLKERETLLRIAPHLVKSLEFLVPSYNRSLLFRLKLRFGMLLYDLLSFDKSLPRHRFMEREEVACSEPSLRRQGLQGGSLYYDAQARSPERLCIENLVDAREHGALLFNYTAVTGALRSGDSITGVKVCDRLNGCEEVEVRGRVVVNASGPWFDLVAKAMTGTSSRQIRTTKGTHFVCPQINRRALVLFSPVDGRLFFVIPWLGHSLIGTTDTDFSEDPSEARANRSDMNYLFRSTVSYFPSFNADQILFSNAGVRALVMEKGSESSVSRMHQVIDGTRDGRAGLVSVLGGKLTGYRAISEEVTDLVCSKLGVTKVCSTGDIPLPGGRLEHERPPPLNGVSDEAREHLQQLYGARAIEVLRLASRDERLTRRLSACYPDIAAQVVFAVSSEQCVRISDFIWRRTLIGFSADQGVSAFQTVADLMASELGWEASRKNAEVEECHRLVEQSQLFRTKEQPSVEDAFEK